MHSLRRFWNQQARALNGTNASTRDLAHVLEHSTGSDNLHLLTLLPWAAVLPARGLLRSHRAWCPQCYAEWWAQGQAVYEPLIWSLEIVTVCAKHARDLCEHCPSCQARLWPLTAESRPGYCDQCDQWLGSTSEAYREAVREGRQDVAREVWIAQTVGEVLASVPTIATPPPRTRIAAVVSAYVNHAGGGSNAALARLLGCSKYTIRDCCRGEQLLQLGTLLTLAETVGVSLVRLLTDETLLTCVPPIPNTTRDRPQAYHGPYRQVDKTDLQRQLQEVLSTPTHPPQSLRRVAQELGFDMSYLVKQCPDEAEQIKARYAAYVAHRTQRTRAQIVAELHAVMRDIVARGIYPSRKRVAAELSGSWGFRLPEVCVAWRHLLVELGQADPPDGACRDVLEGPNLSHATMSVVDQGTRHRVQREHPVQGGGISSSSSAWKHNVAAMDWKHNVAVAATLCFK